MLIVCVRELIGGILLIQNVKCFHRFLRQARVSLKRLTEFLSLEELDADNVEKTMPDHSESC